MMSKGHSIFTCGALLAAVVLLAPATALAQVSNVQIVETSPASYDKLKVTWDLPTNTTGISGYRVYYGKVADGATVGADTALNPRNAESMDASGASTKEFTLSGLTHNTQYVAAVVHLDADGMASTTDADLVQSSTNSGADASTSATTEMAGAPAPPRGVMAMGGDGTFKVMWDAPYAGEAGLTIKEYRVQKREVAGGLFGDWVPTEAKGSDYKGGMKVDGDMTMVTFEGLENGTTYQARVMATNSAGVMGDYSIRDGETPAPGDESATVGDDDMMTETPALPLVGILLLGAGLVAAGRRRLQR